MALEDIVKGLRTVDENPVVNPNYNPKTLTDTIECIGKLEQINPRTQEGLAKYRELTGLPTKDIPKEKTELFYEKIYADVTEGFGKYINKHIEPITNELDEKKKTNMGYSFCPTMESGYKGSADYNAVMDAVNSAKKAVEKIQENPMAYIGKQIEDAPDFMKAIIARFPEEVCQIDMKYTQENALGVIRRYDSTKFITETRKPLEELQPAYYADMKTLGEKEKELEENALPDLDTDESAKYFAEVEKAKDELRKRKEQIKMLSGITNAIVKEVIGAIQERENASKKASN